MRQTWITILAAAAFTSAAPASSIAQTGHSRADCDRLIHVLEGKKPANAYSELEKMKVYREGSHYQACIDASQATAEGSASRTEIKAEKVARMDVFNAKGEQVGDIDRLARGRDHRVYVLMTYRGPRWPGNKEVAIPLDRMFLQSQRLLLPGVGEKDLLAMPSVSHISHVYKTIGGNQVVSIRQTSSEPLQTGSAGGRQ